MLMVCDAHKKLEAEIANLMLDQFCEWYLLLLGGSGSAPDLSCRVREASGRCRERSLSSPSSRPSLYISTLCHITLQKSQCLVAHMFMQEASGAVARLAPMPGPLMPPTRRARAPPVVSIAGAPGHCPAAATLHGILEGTARRESARGEVS